jgi:hypothetical protein
MTDRPDPTSPSDPTDDPELPAPEAPDTLAALEDADDTPDALKPMRGESVAAAVGSFMAGIEQQVFQRRPPAIELVQEVQPVRGVSGDGLEITISLPEPDPPKR